MNTVMEQTHIALYRKYRPKGFDNLIGQEHIKKTLENTIASHKVSHAYLFTGPRGTGKTSSSLLFAKAINCKEPIGINPCGKCESCADSNLDIVEMDAASNNGVDDIRELRQNVQMAPLNSKYKVIIIDECHMLSTAAFNALLKTLEEPPRHVVFILATTEAHKLPPTILSRCQRYDFRRITQHDIIERLKFVCVEEGVEAEFSALQVIAQVAAGGMRDALSLLDQAISKAQGPVTLNDVLEITGAVDVRKIGTLLTLIGNKQTEQALQHFNACFEAGNEPKFFVEEMMIYLRDVLVFTKMGQQASLKKAGTDADFAQVVQIIASNNIYGYLNMLQETLNKMKFHHDLQLLMEMTIIQMINGCESDLQRQIDELRELVTSGVVPTIQVSDNSNIVSTQQITEQPTQTDDIDLTGVTSMVTEQTLVNEQPKQTDGIDLTGVETLITEQQPINEQPVITERLNPEEEYYSQAPPPGDNDEPVEVADNVNGFIERALHGEEDWTNFANDPSYQNPPAEQTKNEELLLVEHSETLNEQHEQDSNTQFENESNPPVEQTKNEELSEEGHSAPTNEQQEQSSNILLDDKELEVLDALLTAVKEHRDSFNTVFENVEAELKTASKSTAALFREFTVKAVNDSVVVVMHAEKSKVKLLEKVKNRSLIESVLADLYKPMKLLSVTNQEWQNCTTVFRSVQKLNN